MTVLSIPQRLAFAASALFLSVPVIAIEIMMVSQAPWWRPPYSLMIFWAFLFLCFSILLVTGLLTARKGSFVITAFATTLWIGVSTITAFKMRYPPLFFFTLFLSVCFIGILVWIKHELSQTFFDPKIIWYQGFPKPIPGLECKVTVGEKALSLKVIRIDQIGAFVFASASPGAKPEVTSALDALLEKKKLQLTFSFRDRQMICSGTPMLTVDRMIGVGVQFQATTPDLRKELGKFIELLHVEGYV